MDTCRSRRRRRQDHPWRAAHALAPVGGTSERRTEAPAHARTGQWEIARRSRNSATDSGRGSARARAVRCHADRTAQGNRKASDANRAGRSGPGRGTQGGSAERDATGTQRRSQSAPCRNGRTRHRRCGPCLGTEDQAGAHPGGSGKRRGRAVGRTERPCRRDLCFGPAIGSSAGSTPCRSSRPLHRRSHRARRSLSPPGRKQRRSLCSSRWWSGGKHAPDRCRRRRRRRGVQGGAVPRGAITR